MTDSNDRPNRPEQANEGPGEFDAGEVKPVVRRRRTEEPSVEQQKAGANDQPPPRQRPPRQPAPDAQQRRPKQRPPRQPRPETARSDAAERTASQQGAPAQRTAPRAQKRPTRQDQTRSSAARNGAQGPRPRRAPVEGEYVPMPARTDGARRLLVLGGLALLVVGLIVGLVFVWGSRQMNPSGGPGEIVESVEIPSGASSDRIGELLAEEGIIGSARLFRYYIGWNGAGGWEAGRYVEFRKNSSFDEAIAVLDAGPVPAESSVVRVTEGTALADALVQIADQVPDISVEELQQSLASGEVTSKYKPADVESWEGLLFPDTYQFDEGVTATQVLQVMATKMDTVLDDLGYDRAEALQGRSAYELITIASLIEKETGAPEEERAKISRVISNRLDNKETLGIDAAVLYGLGRTSGGLTKSDLDQDTPYNTRKVIGLPPTPIALPGQASLAAAIEPAEGDWTFYVLTSNDPPSHYFTDDYQDFLKAKQDAQNRGVF